MYHTVELIATNIADELGAISIYASADNALIWSSVDGYTRKPPNSEVPVFLIQNVLPRDAVGNTIPFQLLPSANTTAGDELGIAVASDCVVPAGVTVSTWRNGFP